MADTAPLTVESKGIMPVTAAESHGRPRALFGLWMAANVEFATITTGALATGVFGLSATDAISAIVLGNIIGAVLLAAFSTFGVEYGLPQMIQGAAWFGRKGNKLPSFLNFFGGFSWFGVNTIIGGYALQYMLHTPLIPDILVLCVVQVAIAVIGHDLIHAAEKYFFYLLVAIFVVLSVIAATHIGHLPAAQPKLLKNVGGTSGAFILTLSVVVAYVMGWIPYSSDYTRYLKHQGEIGATKRAVFVNAFAGTLISCIWMEVLGAIIGATVALSKPSDLFTSWMPGWFHAPLIIAIVIGTISANILNIYSATLSSLALGVRLRQWQAALVCGAIGTVISVLAATNFIKNYQDFLFFLGYWTAPWIAVTLIGHFGRRHSRPNAVSAGFLAWIIGIAASVPFFNQYPLFVGAFAATHPGYGDISFAVSAVVASIAYLALSTSDQTAARFTTPQEAMRV
ncbi:cytosine permease [Acidiphilium acidophilum]|uniref:purine-cytosine permease family protein n=1 Tax=Acidiphilium acidophilum TaxID=76588 RepID=UPI002E8E6BFF|nr:cytosine permease [Acidiphilium acidophilum]